MSEEGSTSAPGRQGAESAESKENPIRARDRNKIEIVQSNVGLANLYRVELLKQLITLATALFAFTVGFFTSSPIGVASAPSWLAWGGWLFLGCSLATGLYQLFAWEEYYISYRDYDHHDDVKGGVAYRDVFTGHRRFAKRVQYATLFLGVVFVAIYAALRLRP